MKGIARFELSNDRADSETDAYRACYSTNYVFGRYSIQFAYTLQSSSSSYSIPTSSEIFHQIAQLIHHTQRTKPSPCRRVLSSSFRCNAATFHHKYRLLANLYDRSHFQYPSLPHLTLLKPFNQRFELFTNPWPNQRFELFTNPWPGCLSWSTGFALFRS